MIKKIKMTQGRDSCLGGQPGLFQNIWPQGLVDLTVGAVEADNLRCKVIRPGHYTMSLHIQGETAHLCSADKHFWFRVLFQVVGWHIAGQVVAHKGNAGQAAAEQRLQDSFKENPFPALVASPHKGIMLSTNAATPGKAHSALWPIFIVITIH